LKSKSKKEDAFYTKLIYYFSIVINSKYFKIDDKAKTCVKNLIKICEPLVGFKIYQDLFYLLDNYQKVLKQAILLEIPLSKIDFNEEELISIYSLFTLFIIDDKNLNKTYTSDSSQPDYDPNHINQLFSLSIPQLKCSQTTI